MPAGEDAKVACATTTPYTNGRPAEEQVPDHSTLWQARPDER